MTACKDDCRAYRPPGCSPCKRALGVHPSSPSRLGGKALAPPLPHAAPQVLLHAADRRWVTRPSPRLEFWQGDERQLGPGLRLMRLGGHFPGSCVLLWEAAQDGRGVLFAGEPGAAGAAAHVARQLGPCAPLHCALRPIASVPLATLAPATRHPPPAPPPTAR